MESYVGGDFSDVSEVQVASQFNCLEMSLGTAGAMGALTPPVLPAHRWGVDGQGRTSWLLAKGYLV